MIFRALDSVFDVMRAEKKCAASPGGTFFILLPALTLSTTRSHVPIFER